MVVFAERRANAPVRVVTHQAEIVVGNARAGLNRAPEDELVVRLPNRKQ